LAERAGNVLYAIHQTPDASYVLAGSSTSDSSGDKTEHNRDFNCNPTCTEDYWIVKTDSMGNKQWDKTFG
jgi:hypothetical protein